MDIANPDENELEKLAKELPSEIDRLHQEYNKYFSGAEKKAPVLLRNKVDKKVDRLKALMRQSQSSSLRFRAQTVVNQHASYSTLWEKRLRERETTKLS